MDDLIEALTILRKYTPDTRYYPTSCEHDELYVFAVGGVTKVERTRLSELGFAWSDKDDVWISHRFGSA